MKTKDLFWGIFFIVAGGFIIVNQLGYMEGITLFNLVMTILLLPVMLKSLIRLNFFGIFFSLALLGILFAGNLGISSLTPYPILIVAFFLSVGFSIIFGKHKRHIDCWHHYHAHEHFDEVVNVEDDDVVEFGVSFGSSIKYVNSKNLKKAKLSCSFGALKVYFDNATIDQDGAVIEIDTTFSGVEIYIPKEWKVENGIETSLAGVEEKYNRYNHNGPVVKLVGRANFSGIEIIYI